LSGHPRLRSEKLQDVDARHKAGHDDLDMVVSGDSMARHRAAL